MWQRWDRTAAGLFSGVIGNQGVTYLTWQSMVNRSVTHRGTASTNMSASVNRFTLVQMDEKPASRTSDCGQLIEFTRRSVAQISAGVEFWVNFY